MPGYGFAGLVWSVACLPGLLSAQTAVDPTDEPSLLRATRAVGAVVIDGDLTEPDWERAPMVAGFRQIEPSPGEPTRFPTNVRVLFDDDHLYVGAFLADPDGLAGRVRDLGRDFEWSTNDAFGITIDPFGDGRVSMVFQVNRAGVQRDQIVFDGRTFDLAWDGVWRARTSSTPDGWSVEIAIPWATLRYPAGGGTWRVNFVRTARGAGEVSGWVPWPRGFSPYHLEYGGNIQGLPQRPAARNLRVQPYAVGRGLAQRDTSAWTTTAEADVGLDLKWGVSPSTVLDLTVNTDFAQADVDRQVVNLSRFSVFFPERRPFFLENASLFAVGRGSALQPFFSRRVGLDAGGAPIPIHAGVRLTSRSGTGQAGALLVHQGGAGEVERSTIGVGRYSRNLGAGSRVGGLVAMRYDRAHDAAGSAFNLTGAADTYVRFSSSTYLQGMVSASSHDGPGGDGAAGYVWMASRGPRGYVGWVQEYVGRSYLPASGLVRRQDYLWTSPAAWLDLRPSWRPSFVRSFEPGTYVGVYHRASDGRFLEAEWNIYPVYIRFHNDATIRASAWLHWQDHDVEFRPVPGVVIAPGRYSYQRAALTVSTAPSSRVTANADLVTGVFYDGRLTAFTLSGSVVPSPQASLFVNWTLNALRDVGLDDTDLNAWILAPELRLALNPRVELRAFYEYSSIHDVGAWNARFSWEFRPLSYVYLVYNDRQPGSDALPGAGPAERQVILKATWLRQF